MLVLKCPGLEDSDPERPSKLETILNCHDQLSLEYLWNISGISMEYLWNIYGISMEYLWNMMIFEQRHPTETDGLEVPTIHMANHMVQYLHFRILKISHEYFSEDKSGFFCWKGLLEP